MKPDSPLAAAVETDLRQLVTAEEVFFADHVQYARSLKSLKFRASAGVTIQLKGATPTAWSAVATHAQLPDWTCGIYVGQGAPHTPDQRQGEPTWSHQ